MNNTDVLELKKRFKKGNSIVRIEGCYVLSMDKKIQTYIDGYFDDLSEDEQFRYLEIFRKGLSGVLGKNLQSLSFEKEEGAENPKTMMSLLALRDSELKDKNILNAFYQSIIDNYQAHSNYLILLINDLYDVPVKGTDNVLQGESEEVYSYVYCLICPVVMDKPELAYNEGENLIAMKERCPLVGLPEVGFLYPAFNDRSTDVNELLYYCKDPKDNHPEFIETFLGCKEEPSIDDEKEVFNQIVEDVLSEVQEYDTFEMVRSINDCLNSLVNDKVSGSPVTLNKEGMKDLMLNAGLKEEHVETLEKHFDEEAGEDASFKVDSLREKKNMTMKSDDVRIVLKQDYADCVEVRVIDGRKCIVIPMNSDMEINGIVKRIRDEMKSMDS